MKARHITVHLEGQSAGLIQSSIHLMHVDASHSSGAAIAHRLWLSVSPLNVLQVTYTK